MAAIGRNDRLSSGLLDRLESVQEHFDILHRQIKDGKTTPSTATPHVESDYHKNIISSFQTVSKECTKLVMMFSRPPPPSAEECGSLCRQLEHTILHLVTSFYQMNSLLLGVTLISEVRTGVLKVLKSSSGLVRGIIKDGYSSRHGQLRGTGSVWGSCEAMVNLSTDNKMAAVKQIIASLHLLQDAKKEADELECKGGEDEEEDMEESDEDEVVAMVDRITLSEKMRWSEQDCVTVRPCLRLAEVCVLHVKEVCGEVVCGGITGVDQQDAIVEAVKALSSQLDNLVSELPAPICTPTITRLATSLGHSLLRVMELVDSGCHSDGSCKANTRRHHSEVQCILQAFADGSG